jgi:hypothetical protein
MLASLDLDNPELASLVALLRVPIKTTRWRLAARTKALWAILAKPEPPQRRPQPGYRSW